MTIASIFLLTAGLILIAMSIESVLKSTSPLNISTAFFLFLGAILVGSIGLYSYFSILNYQLFAFLVLKIQNGVLSLIGFSFYYFSLHFPREKKINILKDYFWIFFLFSIAFAIVSVLGFNINQVQYLLYTNEATKSQFDLKVTYNFLHYASFFFSGFLSFVSLISIVIQYSKSHLIYQKKQIRYFLSGIVFFAVSYLLLSLLKNKPTPILYNLILSIVYVVTGGMILYSVITYRFVNLRRKFIDLIRDNIIGTIVSLPIIFLLYIFRSWIGKIDFLIFCLIALPSFLFFVWLHHRGKILIRKSIGMEYLDKDITSILLDKIGNAHTIEELARKSVEALCEQIECHNMDFLYFDPSTENFKVLYSLNSREYYVPAVNPLFRYLNNKIDVYDRELINFDPRFSAMKGIAERYFKRYGISLIVPFFYEENLIGMMHISGKMDNTTYTSRELELMSRLKKISQIIMNNLILFEKEEEARLTKRDLILASNIQESIFQNQLPVFSNIDIYAYQKPAREVSGDYFLVEKISNNSAGLLIADVSGKGFSAALVSMIIHTIAKSHEFSSSNVNYIVTKVNDVITSNQTSARLTKTLSFSTIFCGFLDNSIKTLFYTNAGHNPILVYNIKKNRFEWIKANAKPVGIFQDETFLTKTYHYEHGSIFVLYSDGITETINEKEEEFGTDRLQKIIKENYNKKAKEISEVILEEVDVFSNHAEPFDDITLIVIKL